jgi:hypothetical protein
MECYTETFIPLHIHLTAALHNVRLQRINTVQHLECEMSGSHGGEYEGDSFLGSSSWWWEAVRISETSGYLNETTRRYTSQTAATFTNKKRL